MVLAIIGSNASTSCNGPNVYNGHNGYNGHTNSDSHNGWDGYNCYITFLDIFRLSERPGTLTKKLIKAFIIWKIFLLSFHFDIRLIKFQM